MPGIRLPRAGVRRFARFAASVVLLPALFAATAAVAQPADPPAQGASSPVSAGARVIVRFSPGTQPADGERLAGRALADLRIAVGRPFLVDAPAKNGDQVLVLTGPVTAAEAKAVVRTLRSRPEVLRADVERRPRAVAGSTPKSGVDESRARVRQFVVVFADPATEFASAANAKLTVDHDRLLTEAAGAPMRVVRATAGGAWLVEVEQPVDAARARAILEALQASPGIRRADPVTRERAKAYPNDTYYVQGYQWDLDDPYNDASYGINAARAWSITVGSPSIRVAIVDTGAIQHPDLAGRWAGGYDFVSDTDSSGDGNGRDADPTDPGDWTVQDECGDGEAPSDSSWHGAHVAGTIGATANNNYGIAGINHASGLLAVRVLGYCGGNSVDIDEGMFWAAGGAVPGVPNNPLPARVVNMSLGGSGACSAQRQALIDKTLALGALVVVAAGNESDDLENHTPASCYGVSTVVATDSYGYRSSYSNYGIYADISAPGGDGSYYEDDTEGILSTIDTGAADATGDYDFGYKNGTSMAAPHVSGVASLMLSVNPWLTPAQMKGIMADTASPFNPNSVCNTDHDCGAGIVDAYFAVLESIRMLNVPKVGVIEYYNASLNHYFIAAESQPDVPALDSGAIPGWTRTGRGFYAYPTAQSGLAGVCRFYIPPARGNSHFYSASAEECDAIYAAATIPSHPGYPSYSGFIYETGAAFVIDTPVAGACPPTRVPVWRLWNRRPDTNHRYTTDPAVRDQMIALGSINEGVAFCALP